MLVRPHPPTPRAAASRTVLALLLLAAVSACGQKGPLYLPEGTPMVIVEDTDGDAGQDSGQPATAPSAGEASAAEPAQDEDQNDGDGKPRRAGPEDGP